MTILGAPPMFWAIMIFIGTFLYIGFRNWSESGKYLNYPTDPYYVLKFLDRERNFVYNKKSWNLFERFWIYLKETL